MRPRPRQESWLIEQAGYQGQCRKRGVSLVEAGRWEPSTKTCSACGSVKEEMTLGEREYRCAGCGLVMDRDMNSAMNLKRVGQPPCVETTVRCAPAYTGLRSANPVRHGGPECRWRGPSP